MKILRGIQVIDLSSVLAGPSVASFLGECGAEVIKIENAATNGDVTRTWKIPGENSPTHISAYYACCNAFKKIKKWDLNDPHACESLYLLIQQSDILITNFKKNTLLKFGLDYDAVKQLKKDIIYAHLSGFGPDDSRVAYDLVLQAESGWMYLNREENDFPLKVPVAIIDLFAAHQLKEAILLALIKRMKTGKGSYIHCSLIDAALAALTNQATNFLTGGVNPRPSGSLHPNIAPYGELFKTADNRWLVLAIGSDEQFQKLCTLLDLSGLATNPKFSSNPLRVKFRHELFQLLQDKIKDLEFEYLYEQLKKLQIPAAGIYDVAEAFQKHSAGNVVLKTEVDGVEVTTIRQLVAQIKD